MIVLPIKKKWFDMIASGEKKEEYREMKPYYDKRLGYLTVGTGKIAMVLLRNGYKYNSPTIKCKCAVINYYILKILKIVEVKNYEIPIK